MRNTRLVQRLMVQGLSPKEARERAAQIEAKDTATIARNAATIPTYWSKTIQKNVTVPA